MAEKSKYIIVGGLPAPQGGVTTFLRRLLHRDYDKIAHFLDIYAGEKEPVGLHAAHRVRQLAGIRGLLQWMWSNRNKLKGATVCLHFSRASSLLLLLLLPKPRNCRFVLTLHHGKLALNSGMVGKAQYYALRQLDLADALSEEQRVFYEQHGLDASRIRMTSPYCSPTDLPDDPAALEWIERAGLVGKKLLVMSGSPIEIYEFDKGIDLFIADRDHAARLIIFLYGNGPLRPHLRARAASHARIVLIEDASEVFFNTILRRANLLLRLNTIDSFGIAVADAVNFGVEALATDVCERYPGTRVFPLGSLAMATGLQDLRRAASMLKEAAGTAHPKAEYYLPET